jgi:cardiolipin synthase
MIHTHNYYIVNSITSFRIIAFPILMILIFIDGIDLFKWFLAISFFTDAIDGYLARKLNVTSTLGTKLDSIGDILTIVAAVTGMFMFKLEFVKSELTIIIVMLMLFIIQLTLAFFRYKTITSFHTYLAKSAAILQGMFLITSFFVTQPFVLLFYIAAIVTILELIEESMLVLLLPQWKTDVKGIYWIMKENLAKGEKNNFLKWD